MKQVTKGQWNGYDTYILHSRELEVTLLPWLGNNVISIWDNIQNRQVLRTPDENDLAFYMQKPYHFGMPMLIPPGRIRGGTSNMKAAVSIRPQHGRGQPYPWSASHAALESQRYRRRRRRLCGNHGISDRGRSELDAAVSGTDEA